MDCEDSGNSSRRRWLFPFCPGLPALRAIAPHPEAEIKIAARAVPMPWTPERVSGLHARLSPRLGIAKALEMEIVGATSAVKPIPRQDATLGWGNGPHIRGSNFRHFLDISTRSTERWEMWRRWCWWCRGGTWKRWWRRRWRWHGDANFCLAFRSFLRLRLCSWHQLDVLVWGS